MRGPGCITVFYRSFEKNDAGCWLWEGPRKADGYGVINTGPKKYPAHRLSLQLASAEMGDGLYACHHCDTPACVRPDHLFWGTQADNMRDASRKGRLLGAANAAKTHCPYGHPLSIKRKSDGSRYCPTCYKARCKARHQRWRELHPKSPNPIGVNHGKAKLTDSQVLEIRSSKENSAQLAQRLGVSKCTLNDIRKKRTWRHIP